MAAISKIHQVNVDLPSIKPFQEEPIKTIPKYLFENCNLEICNNYNSEYLMLLRAKARVITPYDIIILKIDDSKKKEKAKEFDWIYALDQLEKEYLKNETLMLDTALKIEDLKKMNGYLSRLTENPKLRDNSVPKHQPGDFRKINTRWSKNNLNVNELIAIKLFEKEISKDCPAGSIGSISDDLVTSKSFFVKASFLRKKLQYYKKHPNLPELAENAFLIPDIDPEIVENWKDSNGRINICKWLKARMHYFPNFLNIQSELQSSLDSIKDPKMHPIEKAAKIWFDIVRIHTFYEGNKRTGKAIGSAILLLNGYLPPFIKEEDYKEYIDCFEKNFEEKDGHIPLTNFIAKKILEIQKKSRDEEISKLSLNLSK